MREAGAPSTENVTVLSVEVCPPPPGVVMVAPLEVPRNAEGEPKRRPREWEWQKERKQRGQRQYKGWDHTPSFAAAREPCPSRGLLQRSYMSVFRG
jgi:hypothetical protein